MEHGQTNLAQLQQILAASNQPAWVRAVGGPAQAGAAPLWHAEVVVGPVKPQVDRLWRYADCTFASGTVSAKDFAIDLESGESQALRAAGQTFAFSPSHDQCNHQRKPRFAQFDEPRLPWPSTLYTLNLQQPQQHFQPPSGYLVGPKAPTFAAFAAAFRAFYANNYALSGASNPSLAQLLVHNCDLRGWITEVRIQPTGLEIESDGENLRVASVELMSTRHRDRVPVSSEGATRILLPDGLSDDAWLWLRLDDDWLDYRSLGAYEAAVNQDVRDERSVDSELDLAAMIAQGEGQQLEFKRRLPEHTAPSRRSALKTVVAFANGDGGTLFYGVDDDGTVVGIEGGNDRTPDQFNDLLRSWTAPMPSFEARVERVNEMVVLVVDVNGDSGTIHALTLDSDKPEYYVRRGATTFYARPEELQAIAANRGTPDHQAWNSMF